MKKNLEKEVVRALKCIKEDKVIGLDGFTMKSFENIYNVIRNGMIKVLKYSIIGQYCRRKGLIQSSSL